MSAWAAAVQSLGFVALLVLCVTLSVRLHWLTRAVSNHGRNAQ